MPIISIISQPGSASVPKIYAAYRPIIFIVAATAAAGSLTEIRMPPVVYCDIYFNSVFYKTLPATQYYYLDTTNTQWKFDISAAAQEYLSFNLPANGATVIEVAAQVVVNAFCRFRSSAINTDGFLIAEGIAPKQGTGSKAAVAGTGTDSESFQVINAVLQHEDNQDLQTHLQYGRPNAFFQTDTYPLTHRPASYKVCKTDSDHYPFVHLGNRTFSKITVYRFKKDGTTINNTYVIPQTCASVVSAVSPNVILGNDTLVNFNSSGPATIWEWSISGGATWTPVNKKSFTITYEDLLTIIITEAGEPVLTENGEIIIPEAVNPFTDYTLQIRPRCANGAYGTTGSAVFTIAPPVTCPVISLFSFSSINYTNSTITFALTFPFGYNDMQLEWKFDYGNGFVSNAATIDYENAVHPFVWNAPPMANTGTYKVRVRNKCGTDDYSVWSSWVNVVWNKPVVQVAVTLVSVIAASNTWTVTCSLSQAVADDVVIRGYFMGDGPFGVQGFNFTCVILAGATTGITTVPGAATGALAFNKSLTNVNPDPTSDGKDLIW
jgi:hypothetical protein